MISPSNNCRGFDDIPPSLIGCREDSCLIIIDCCLITGGLYNIGGVFPIWTLILIIGAILAVVVACTSRSDRQPIYHCVSYVLLALALAHISLCS